jgi:4-hydroxy-tetrahydrodipicolinate reductase
MVKIRDPEQQLEMVGVPEEHIEGHAFHLYHLTSPMTGNSHFLKRDDNSCNKAIVIKAI